MDTTQPGISLAQLRRQRQDLLDQIGAIDRFQRGTLSKQFFKKRVGAQTKRQGPYYVLQWWLGRQKVSRRICQAQVAQTQADLAAYRQFEALVAQFVRLTEQMTLVMAFYAL